MVPIIQTLLLTVIALSIERYFAIRSAIGKGSLAKFVANTGTFGIRQATYLIEPLNAAQQTEMRKISLQNAGLSLTVGWDVTKNPWIGTTRTDWMDEIFRTALDVYKRQILFNGIADVEGTFGLDEAYVGTLPESDAVHYIVRFIIHQF